jgi:hypothetical protein
MAANREVPEITASQTECFLLVTGPNARTDEMPQASLAQFVGHSYKAQIDLGAPVSS